MNKRENLLSLLRREGYSYVPCEFQLSPPMINRYKEKTRSELHYMEYFDMPWRYVSDSFPFIPKEYVRTFGKYYDFDISRNCTVDVWGVYRGQGSDKTSHLFRTVHPLGRIESMEELLSYPFPKVDESRLDMIAGEAASIKKSGLATVGSVQCTIWETAWYLRGMSELLMDMVDEDEKAVYLLNKITEIAIERVKITAKAGVDILYLGDDVGTQRGLLMSEDMYTGWLKPLLKKVIDAARNINPDIIIIYHTCGYVKELIPHLIDAGIDVLNPVQPETMEFEEIHAAYGDKLSFCGTIGIQTTMAFGKVVDVREAVHKNLRIAGAKGGLLCSPAHVLEPDVPWENVLAYSEACKSFDVKKGFK